MTHLRFHQNTKLGVFGTGCRPLLKLFRPERLTAVVDIGANPIDGDPPYKTLLQIRGCRLTGFEPQAEALATLNTRKSDLETYLPNVIADGKAIASNKSHRDLDAAARRQRLAVSALTN
jgi:hypothetical protein